MQQITLPWKSFTVNLDRLHKTLKSLCSEDYDGLIASPEHLVAVLKNPNEPDSILIAEHWNSLTESSESTPTSDELKALAAKTVKAAIDYGQGLVVEFAAENILLGITASGKTKLVADYLADAMRYAQSGSLYEVAAELDRLLQEEVPSELAPFITTERLLQFKQKVMAFFA